MKMGFYNFFPLAVSLYVKPLIKNDFIGKMRITGGNMQTYILYFYQ